MMKIYLIRHGQTTGDIEDRFGGDYDDHLTEEGKSQSNILANKLVDKGIEKIFASPRFRAQETAKILSDTLGVELQTVEDIRERNAYGILTGMIKSEAKEKYPKEFEEVKSYKNTTTGAEEYAHFKQRVIAALNEISSGDQKVVAIVSHGGPISCFFREVLGQEIFGLRDCGFAELEKNGEYKLLNVDGLMIKG
jgi:broad specificity phosphatase PhoE